MPGTGLTCGHPETPKRGYTKTLSVKNRKGLSARDWIICLLTINQLRKLWDPFFRMLNNSVLLDYECVLFLICWIYEQTGSVLYAQMMHAISTGSLVMFGAATVTPAGETLWYGCYGTLLFLIIGSGYYIYQKKNKT